MLGSCFPDLTVAGFRFSVVRIQRSSMAGKTAYWSMIRAACDGYMKVGAKSSLEGLVTGWRTEIRLRLPREYSRLA